MNSFLLSTAIVVFYIFYKATNQKIATNQNIYRTKFLIYADYTIIMQQCQFYTDENVQSIAYVCDNVIMRNLISLSCFFVVYFHSSFRNQDKNSPGRVSASTKNTQKLLLIYLRSRFQRNSRLQSMYTLGCGGYLTHRLARALDSSCRGTIIPQFPDTLFISIYKTSEFS